MMLPISQEFINNLWVPLNWSYEYIDNDLCYILNNTTDCHLFWMQYWYEVLCPDYATQKIIQTINTIDLTTRVIIRKTPPSLILVPNTWTKIYYYAKLSNNRNNKITSPFALRNITVLFAFLLGSFLILCLMFFSRFFKK